MIHVQVTAELPADEYGPHERYIERIELPGWFAAEAAEAHARLLTLLVTEPYFELPQRERSGLVPFRSETVRTVGVWDSNSERRGLC